MKSLKWLVTSRDAGSIVNQQGQSLDVGERTLTAFRPPLYDSPATIGLYDDRSQTCFSSDCFGAPSQRRPRRIQRRRRRPRNPTPLRSTALGHRRQPLGAHHRADKYLSTIEPLRAMDPAVILSTHLPPAVGQTSKFLDMLAAAPHADPFVGPDQHALEEMLAGFEPATTAG